MNTIGIILELFLNSALSTSELLRSEKYFILFFRGQNAMYDIIVYTAWHLVFVFFFFDISQFQGLGMMVFL